ncbi:hypothetical protein ACQEVZ_09375 [Dactylosporangium sp. CA-152071]|uniref:hypothetical protein n=1 Tax=Dactylosporangium sp. CA-152071 TaxID=3239933 RepID=UPI003D8FD119
MTPSPVLMTAGVRLDAPGAVPPLPPAIAATLVLSVGTVRDLLMSAGTKLHARNRVDAIRIATETGWI